MKIILSLALLFVFPISAFADYYIVKDCANNGDGSSWTCAAGAGGAGAFNDMPADSGCTFDGYVWVRGVTYWVAGSDTAYRATCLRRDTGTGTVTIKKASASSHGTDTGWQASYGTKQAVLGAVSTPYDYAFENLTIDGSYRTDETSGYGFKIIGGVGDNTFGVTYYAGHTSQYLEVTSPNTPITHDCIASNLCTARAFTNADGSIDGATFQYLYIHDVGLPFMLNGNNITIDNVRAERNDSSNEPPQEHHSECTSTQSANNLTIKNSKWIDIEGTACFAFMNGGTPSTVNIFNNLIYCTGENQCGFGNGVITCTNTSTVCTGFNFFSNTMVNLPSGTQAMVDQGSNGTVDDWVVKNNLWWCDSACAGASNESLAEITYDDNWYGGVTFNASENGAIDGDDEDPFVDSVNNDYRLSASATPVNAGTALGSPFNVDINGVSRPQGAAWDIGAMEYYEQGNIRGVTASGCTFQ